MSILILPGHPLFDETLATPVPGWKAIAAKNEGCSFVMGDDGIYRTATPEELFEYLNGGEYDELMGDSEDDLEYIDECSGINGLDFQYSR